MKGHDDKDSPKLKDVKNLLSMVEKTRELEKEFERMEERLRIDGLDMKADEMRKRTSEWLSKEK